VLARADDYPDALVGAPLAAAKNAPLLLTQGAQLPTDTAQEIARVLAPGGTVYLLGGTAAIPATVASELATSGYQTMRYAGADRFATAVAVADALGDPGTVLLATGTNFPDALSAGPAAAHLHGAVLLTNGASMPAATGSYLSAKSATVYAIGGPAAAADQQANAIVGTDRYATAAAVATRFFPAPATVGIATGATFPDALAGGAQLAMFDAPLLLSAPATIPGVTSTYLNDVRAGVTDAHVYGGTAALSATVFSQLRSAVGG
jgi:putative cell wall-binding protein